MGSLYVSQFGAMGCPDIPANAYRVLMRMALAVYDAESEPGKEDEGLYYGGWKGLTFVLGLGVYDREDELPARVERKIARSISHLKAAGYISVADKKTQREHWNRVYRLHLPGPEPRVTRPQSV